jgi:hypothetical protein
MPARESSQLHDMHELMQQLETLHSAHDLDHLGGAGSWFTMPKMPDMFKTDNMKLKEKQEKEKKIELENKWNTFDLRIKIQILTKFINDKLTDAAHVKVLDGHLTPKDRESKDIEKHKNAFRIQVTHGDDAKIKEFTDDLLNKDLTKQMWIDYIMRDEYRPLQPTDGQ